MGNVPCLDRLALCGPRKNQFLAPNANEAFYIFDHVAQSQLWEGATGSTAAHGYPLDHRWQKICQCSASNIKLCISGRLHVQCASQAVSPEPLQSIVFRLCSRGRQYDEVRSGVHFALHLKAAGTGLLLCPFISLMLTDGEEVGLVADTLGPVPQQDFLVDFSVVDEGGCNLQMDIIFRGLRMQDGKTGFAEASEQPYDWTLRTCLQEFTRFNDVEPKEVYLAAANLQVHLQNLVASEEDFMTQPWSRVNDWLSLKKSCVEAGIPVLFEGGAESLNGTASEERHSSRDFWHHMVFDMVHGRASPSAGLEKTQGEFWMSKRAMNMQPVYVYCKLTMAQAMVSCISLRFSCQMDYLDMLQNTPTAVQLKYPHIPSRGVIMGVEQDPRHPRLLRMFIEFRNEILEDMILCEVDAEQADKIFVQQEIYDSICALRYRVVILHPDGNLSGELKVKNQRLEDFERAPSKSMHFFEEPSWRFPIAPLASRMANSAGSRVFLYTGIPHVEAETFEQPNDGVLHKPSQNPPLWKKPLVESVAIISDITGGRWLSS